jgi:Flp pilus assembly protein TadD
VTLAAFSGLAHNGFVGFDDNVYLTDNAMVRRGLTIDGIAWAFRTTDGVNWHPVSWLSHMLDVSLFGMRPGAHHLVGLLLHGANTVLLFGVMRSFTGTLWRSALVAALFAVHPLHVESVAWASERKDLLSTGFVLLALLAWRRHLGRPTAARYAAVCLLFAAALLAKPMPVTFPFVLLLLDWWPLGRWEPLETRRSGARRSILGAMAPWSLWREKAPFFVLAAASSAVTYVVQRGAGAMSFGEHLGVPARAVNAALSWMRYLGKALWPRDLAILYPLPGTPPPWWLWGGAVVALAGITFAAVRLHRSRPWLSVGWFWYLGTLVPVIGLVQVGSQSMADRYTYLPLTGIFLAVAWEIAAVVRRRPKVRFALIAAVLGLLGALIAATRAQTAVWRDDITLFRHALAVTERNWIVHHHLGNALAAAGRDDEAVSNYLETLSSYPFHVPTHNNLGGSYARQGRTGDAERHFRIAIALQQDYAPAHYNLGTLLLERGDLAGAERSFREANRLEPDSADILNSLGVALLKEGRIDEAATRFAEALHRDPGHRLARVNLERLGPESGTAPHQEGEERNR